MVGLIPEASPQRDGGPSLARECGSKNTDNNIVRVLTFCQNLLNASHACIHSPLLQKQITTNLVASNTDFSSSGGQKSETGLTRTKSKVSVGLASFWRLKGEFIPGLFWLLEAVHAGSLVCSPFQHGATLTRASVVTFPALTLTLLPALTRNLGITLSPLG